MDWEDPNRPGILPEYAHLRSFEEGMPVIRKILGVSEHGGMPDNFIGKAMQTFINANREEALRKSRVNSNKIIE